MITLFACPKPFKDKKISIIQRNAIRSWTLLSPKPDIILFGDDFGVDKICQEFGLKHIAYVVKNEFGTPLVSDIFRKAQDMAEYNILCYVNADIILMSDFIQAVSFVSKLKRPEFFIKFRRVFLIAGQRYDLDIDDAINFDDADWEIKLKSAVKEKGKIHPPYGSDYFVFPRGMFRDIPDFAIGRPGWDNWLIYKARAEKIPVVDATDVIIAVHQNHDYSHAPGGDIWKGKEFDYNLSLSRNNLMNLTASTHKLMYEGSSMSVKWILLQRALEKFLFRIKGFFSRI
ncbi:MAG: hypothetical protein RMJ45_07950 [Candidatus Calescibacterium sp.]|nr:hypothetical protein [Candidatus Calescibacterium sp.]